MRKKLHNFGNYGEFLHPIYDSFIQSLSNSNKKVFLFSRVAHQPKRIYD